MVEKVIIRTSEIREIEEFLKKQGTSKGVELLLLYRIFSNSYYDQIAQKFFQVVRLFVGMINQLDEDKRKLFCDELFNVLFGIIHMYSIDN